MALLLSGVVCLFFILVFILFSPPLLFSSTLFFFFDVCEFFKVFLAIDYCFHHFSWGFVFCDEWLAESLRSIKVLDLNHF